MGKICKNKQKNRISDWSDNRHMTILRIRKNHFDQHHYAVFVLPYLIGWLFLVWMTDDVYGFYQGDTLSLIILVIAHDVSTSIFPAGWCLAWLKDKTRPMPLKTWTFQILFHSSIMICTGNPFHLHSNEQFRRRLKCYFT
jgi:hypothetical protein